MILIGMFDSPFVRRVAVSMKLLGFAFEHRNWSVGADFERIREYNPLGQVPTLVLDDGEVLVDSTAILDHLDERAGAQRALVPPSGPARRTALQLLALTLGAAEKGRTLLYERVFRPESKWHEPWMQRCRAQLQAALEELEARCGRMRPAEWLLGDQPMQPDITLACVMTFLGESAVIDPGAPAYVALRTRTQRIEALDAFRSTYLRWGAPQST